MQSDDEYFNHPEPNLRLYGHNDRDRFRIRRGGDAMKVTVEKRTIAALAPDAKEGGTDG